MLHDNDSFRIERRARNFTEADIDALVEKINSSKHLDCRFQSISIEDLEEAIKFYKNFNKLMTESGNTIWKTLLILGVGGLCSLILLGIYSKIRENI